MFHCHVRNDPILRNGIFFFQSGRWKKTTTSWDTCLVVSKTANPMSWFWCSLNVLLLMAVPVFLNSSYRPPFRFPPSPLSRIHPGKLEKILPTFLLLGGACPKRVFFGGILICKIIEKCDNCCFLVCWMVVFCISSFNWVSVPNSKKVNSRCPRVEITLWHEITFCWFFLYGLILRLHLTMGVRFQIKLCALGISNLLPKTRATSPHVAVGCVAILVALGGSSTLRSSHVRAAQFPTFEGAILEPGIVIYLPKWGAI